MTTFRLPLLIAVLAFIVSFVAVAQPGQAQAALTLNNFFGCETNGTDEFLSSSGTPICQGATVRTGDWSLELDPGDNARLAMITGGSTDSDNDFILGFAARLAAAPGSTSLFVVAQDDVDGLLWQLSVNTSRQVVLADSNTVTIGTSAATISTTGWTFIEVRWQHLASGAIDLFMDGSSEISGTGKDLTQGNAVSADNAAYQFSGITTAIPKIDDFYAYSGGTGTGDFLGNAEVFRYQANTNSATPDRACSGSTTNLSAGVWQDLGETPRSADTTEPSYTGAGGGGIDTDDTQSGNNFRPGPNGDSNIDGTIQGGKWSHYLRRGNGSGTVHSKCFGNSGDGVTAATVSLDIAYGSAFHTISTSGTVVPTASEYCSQGMARGAGGRDIFSEEIWCFLLHVPPTGGARRIFQIE